MVFLGVQNAYLDWMIFKSFKFFSSMVVKLCQQVFFDVLDHFGYIFLKTLGRIQVVKCIGDTIAPMVL